MDRQGEVSVKLNNSFFYNHLYNNNQHNKISGNQNAGLFTFHLPNGILFTFHLQYTNLTNNPLGISFKAYDTTFNLYNWRINFYVLQDLHRGIFSIV